MNMVPGLVWDDHGTATDEHSKATDIPSATRPITHSRFHLSP